jgi:hypothetical protein
LFLEYLAKNIYEKTLIGKWRFGEKMALALVQK